MARIKEFKGLRPVKKLVSRVSELPYDVVTSREARAIADKNEYSIYHIVLPEVDLPDTVDPHDDIVYAKGRENIEKFIEKGILESDASPRLYLYSLIMNNRTQTGLLACVHADDYINNRIKKHELTLPVKAEDRRRHIDTVNAHTGLIFLLYKEDGSGKKIFEEAMKLEPEYDFTTNDEVRHILRAIQDRRTIKGFKDIFNKVDMYIADGHHRAASAVNVALKRREKDDKYTGEEEYNWFPAVIFPHDQLNIMPYNRVIKDLNGASEKEYFEKIKEKYTIEAARKEAVHERHIFRMYFSGSWHRLIPKFSIPDDSIRSLDAQILQDTILNPILGITDPARDNRIGFVGGIKGEKELQRLVDSGEFKVAFSLHPVVPEELIRVSDENKLMPPKSTWFEPKLRSGLVIHQL